ncbi:ABC transporter ATP-binding protein [Actinospica durhamensis]|uniref:ABC transporter ATP-binding protein n=1 Tax=Actinospica durhamensis TaxID=1508375 RepID=A0A941EJB6_9ACTN|nr:ABC transporter ATP-binding protein [Actinospica durhamensis]MBR7831805.1 ABC transporter ATP-binding protein [Actinospica durhamensis]
MTSTTLEYALEADGLVQHFARPGREPLHVLDGLDLRVREGEFAAVLGPSGSGKSTLLNILAGLDRPGSGAVRVGGSGSVAYMPQKDLLFPWRTVEDNAILGLEVAGVKKKAAREQVAPLFEEFGLAGFEHSYPAQLSGGMRQRAALLRTVAMNRPVLLLDEPFGALDALTRTQLHLWLAETRQRHGWTIVLVTHDIREAVILADSVHVLSPRPARVTHRLEIDLPLPRTADTFALPEFARLERELLVALGTLG